MTALVERSVLLIDAPWDAFPVYPGRSDFREATFGALGIMRFVVFDDQELIRADSNTSAQQPTSVIPSIPGQRKSPAQDTNRCWSTNDLWSLVSVGLCQVSRRPGKSSLGGVVVDVPGDGLERRSEIEWCLGLVGRGERDE